MQQTYEINEDIYLYKKKSPLILKLDHPSRVCVNTKVYIYTHTSLSFISHNKCHNIKKCTNENNFIFVTMKILSYNTYFCRKRVNLFFFFSWELNNIETNLAIFEYSKKFI